ncbi:MAG: Rpn family recombination-promoting nuclease/putative transposase [Deltaproteobacteria bacterium]|nr:Rpn family recombination-promoting nuclease/putative transposase [Deltaproteobacteria bacterium]
MPSHPHDRLSRRIFSNPAHASAELRTILPAELVAALNLSELEVVPGASYIDEVLADRQVDLLYRVPLWGSDESALVYVLFEHQSSVDPRMPARLLVYMARIWEQWMRARPSGKLPLIVPAVLHHSSSGWTAASRFAEVLAIPDQLRTGLQGAFVDFSFFLDDLTSSTEEELHQRAQMTAVARLALSALRLGQSGQPADIDRWAQLLLETLQEPDGLRAFETVLRYLAHVRDDDDDFIDVLVRATDDEEVEAIAMTYRERLIQQGRDEGREGARGILAKLLLLKFGELNERTESRLANASLAELEAWSERVLTAETVDAIFES